MSVDYYSRLEQARGPHPSRQILNALARALMLTADERAHLFHLAGEQPAPARGPRRDVPEGVMHLLAGLDSTPAYVVDAKYDVLAWNEMLELLMGGMKHGNFIRWTFAAGGCTKDEFARGSVAELRAASARYPDDKGIQALVAEMLACSKDFAEIWADHEVVVSHDMQKSWVHPLIGPLDLQCQVLHIPDRDQRVVFYLAAPGSRAQAALGELRALTNKDWVA